MKNIKLTLLSLSFLFIGCGTNIDDRNVDRETKIYDLWEYMVPQHNYEVEYESYKNGVKIDYFFETTRVINPSLVERESHDLYTRLIREENAIQVKESNGATINIQRFIKIGDTHIFNGSSNYDCNVENFFHSIKLKNIEFFNTIKINCQKEQIRKELYYAYNEGLVFISQYDYQTKEEAVKIGERRVQ